MFYPSKLREFYVPPVALTDFQLFNNLSPAPDSLLPKAISLLDELRLTYKDSVFSFEFSALGYSTPS